ncbi:hypothetical protein ASD40_04035 [Paenibacillus sp. Root444D2]|nr:hypothetical protein ASD40_04035 [Paenibacillus sp. Root444D2]
MEKFLRIKNINIFKITRQDTLLSTIGKDFVMPISLLFAEAMAGTLRYNKTMEKNAEGSAQIRLL